MTSAALFAALCLAAATSASAATPVETHGALHVEGSRVLDQHGKPVALAGPSFFWSNTGWGQEKFYNANAVKTFATDWHASIVRAAMGVDAKGGFLQDPANEKRVETLVDAAIANGVYVIIDWHSHHAEQYSDQAVAFFQRMAKKYGRTPNVIYELYNEPLKDVSWSQTIKPYADKVIGAIRAIDPDNLIVVGTPTWSQDVDLAAADPLKGPNLLYSLHFYAGTHKQFLRDKADVAMSKGAPLFVTEWGSVDADGNGAVDVAETRRWQDYLRAHCLSQAQWAVSDRKEGASLFKPGTSGTGPWTDNDLTDSGKLLREILKNWNTQCQ
ncbi:glycoside hydrolase family 5 protein [Massilia sp. 9096]|uniref:glycoside hydrolase family 5 protein n=1 Tax=Massilia sp. 9096 TaxID=1500894 RepID=UPI00068BCCA0|nr:glycoside hydrolase family 5 protein [Massilia sp. 9096]